MLTLGIGGSNHDFSAALVEDGRIVAAIEDERITRHRYGNTHWASHPCVPSSQYCLSAHGIDFDKLDGFFVNEDIETNDKFWQGHRHTLVKHHLCHAAASFYPSPFDEAAILVIDGRGGPISGPHGGRQQFETVSIGRGQVEKLNISVFQSGCQTLATSTWSYVTSNSLGWLYSVVTEAIGLGENGEGKTMALAAYGRPTYVSVLGDFYSFDDEGRFSFDPYSGIWDCLMRLVSRAGNGFQVRADLAASVQQVLETGVIRAASVAKAQSNARLLCYGGGVALNGLANHKLRSECGFEDVFVFPACADNGLAIGAALYGCHALLGCARRVNSWQDASSIPFCGRKYTENEIDQALSKAAIAVSPSRRPAEELADRLLIGQTVAIYVGRSEIGPRALGHRSILADPSERRIQARLNTIKNRQSFRPFAPIVLESAAGKYFELAGPSPFMLDIAPIRPDWRTRLAGACHVDGTARVQTVPDEHNTLVVQLLRELERRGRPPVVLNTSFNLSRKPIVETPQEAVDTFVTLDLDAMWIEGRWVEKHTPFKEAQTDGNGYEF